MNVPVPLPIKSNMGSDILFDEAIAHFERAVPLKKEIGDERGLVTCVTTRV